MGTGGFVPAGALAAGVLLGFSSLASAAIIKDFNSGVGPEVNHPNPANSGTNALNTWTDITDQAFGSVAAGTLDGSPALRINDGGFVNGMYIIYSGVVSTSGEFRIEARMKVTEDAAQLNSIRAYQIGVRVNGTHRGANPSALTGINAALPGEAVGSYAGLTTGNDNALATQTVVTDSFFATAGDTLLLAFSTDVVNSAHSNNSATWGAGGFVTVDNIDLVTVPEPGSLFVLALGAAGLLARRRID